MRSMQQVLYNKLFKRSLAEKLLSFFIFLTISFLFQSLIIWISSYSTFNFIHSKYLFHKLYIVLYSFYFILLSISSWIVWKNHSFQNLKLESTLLVTIASLAVLWNYLFLTKQSYFFSLIISLFILFFSLIVNLLLWKKEKIAALVFSIASTWSLYLFIINMSISAAKGNFL
ncbi:MAG: hypothetical protein KR126chlam6_01421 [Candidatus Anoxychlamydiales bacterium]|nr:hypothetical protein [Candidatus Anoxychlamydiales bacterium]